MEGLIELIGNPWAWGLVAAYWVFCAAADALPTLDYIEERSGAPAPLWYVFAFKLVQGLAGNLRAAFPDVPGANR